MPHEQFKSCIEACFACAEACDHCAASCLRENEVQKMARCIALDIDCAEICRLATGYMSRDSECAEDLCELCADVCDMCAEECARHSMDHCKACAEACRRCAGECRRMAGTQSSAVDAAGGERRTGERRAAH